MHLTEDTLVFEKGFEFAVYPYVAKVQENDENSFHWHRYCEITLFQIHFVRKGYKDKKYV